jgi:pyrroline-5-carboxylate reductase
MTLVIVGGGRMGEALLGGLLASGRAPGELAVVEVMARRREELANAYDGVAVEEAPSQADAAVLAVKPHDVPAAARAAAEAGAKRILSVAAGVTTAAIEEAAGELPVVRAMPNTPALVGMGAAAISAGAHAGEEDLAWAEEVLGAVGVVVRVPESSLDAVTGLSGSGPAYVFLVAEAMVEAGVLAGLPRPTAETLAFQTLAGAAKLIEESDQSPADLRAAVTSPGGTTAAGLRELERGGVRAAFLEAVSAAAERSRELGA